jgi:hypothetical protein
MSTEMSPLMWQDAVVAMTKPLTWDLNSRLGLYAAQWLELDEIKLSELWFTTDDLCLPKSPKRQHLLHGIRKRTADQLSARQACDKLRRRRPEWLDQYQID